ncbi:MAG: hypothetical protein QF886_10820, partial [Planctomycetota bacterium]|nr:hypothetical protein [Planctomycetota bacterium]
PSGAASANDWWWFKRYWHQGEPEKYVEDQRFQKTRRRPTTDSRPKLTVPNATSCRARWRALDNGPTEDALTFEVESVAETGEILLTVVFRTSDKDTPPVSLDVPVLNLKGKSVVLGSGAKYERKDERWVDCTTRVSNGLYSPNVAVIEGDRAVVGIRAEERNFEYANIWLAHTPESDSVILNTTIPYGGRPAEDDRSVLRSVTWRIGVYASWVEAARRWRHLFRTHRGARPLWEQSCEWARGIHAVNTQVQEPAKAQEFYQKLATKLDTEKVLLFYWNGSRVILHGDHRYIAKSARPKPQVIDAFKKHGFRWMGYHGYVLLNPPHAAAARLKDFATKGELPQGYSFQPDYGGPPEDFLDTFRPVSTGYYHPMDKARLWVIHPGTKLCRDYLLRNLDNYCGAHRMDGAYLDILGASSSHQFPPEKKVMEGVDWRTGEWGLLEALRTKHPHLGLMSEYQHERSMPHTFYSWSGTAQVVRLKEVGTRLNHPLRTALWGSFTWTREQEIDPADAALMGTLPDVTLGDDWEVARAKLFTDEELFNDLPEEWGNDALASYRGRDDRWFQFRNLPYGDGFTEVTDAGPELRLGRFRGVHQSPLAQPARIQGWPAYRDGTPAGLNPGRTYPFLLEEHRQDSPFQLTALPGDVFIESISHSENQSVLTFGSSKQAGCEIQIRFHQKCMRIHDSARTVEGPFEEGSLMTAHTTVPGGLVFEWKESATVDTRFRGFISQANGRTRSHGVPDRLWAYNSR